MRVRPVTTKHRSARCCRCCARFRRTASSPTSNLIFFLDGEEEAGSPHLGDYMDRYRDLIDPIDIWLFFDGPVHQSGRPQVTFGVRGSMGVEVTVYGATRELHSGHYGNWAPDTPQILARLLASMKDENGRVLVDGWYDSADPIGPEERAALAAMPDYDAELKKELGLAWTEGQPAVTAGAAASACAHRPRHFRAATPGRSRAT